MNNDFFKFGIIGNPLLHSISPTIQSSALLSANLNGCYEKFEVSKEDIPRQIEFFKDNDFSGFNVTIPHKLEILKYLDEIDETAKKIGAVNTVKITDDKKLVGYNTDIYGFYGSLKGDSISNASIIGCGGAALAVVFGLEILGCKKLDIYARNTEKAQLFVKNIKLKTKIQLIVKPLETLDNLENTDILINATPLGTKGINEDKSPVDGNIFASAQKSMIVYDLVYNPSETIFLKAGKNCGLKTTNGLDMLILQGAKAFEIWTGIYPNVEKMKIAATNELI